MKSEEIKKGLKEIKSFIISELKNEESNWYKHEGRDEIDYKSKWLNITIPCDDHQKNRGKNITISLRGTDSYSNPTYSLKDIGLSKMRFNWLLKYNVDFFIKNREKRQKSENLVSNWNNFLTKNKSLNRDKKLEKILNQ
jgi:hypothetical protein